MPQGFAPPFPSALNAAPKTCRFLCMNKLRALTASPYTPGLPLHSWPFSLGLCPMPPAAPAPSMTSCAAAQLLEATQSSHPQYLDPGCPTVHHGSPVPLSSRPLLNLSWHLSHLPEQHPPTCLAVGGREQEAAKLGKAGALFCPQQPASLTMPVLAELHVLCTC